MLRDGAHRQMQLVMAIAAQGLENFARRALRMNADHGRGTVNVAQKQSQRGFEALLARSGIEVERLESEQAKVGPAGRKAHIGDLLEHGQERGCLLSR